MNIIDTVILGVVEGITEFLPISSTGHLILTSHLLGQTGQIVNSFEVFIQLGAIMAVVFLYSNRFKMLFDFKSQDSFAGKKGWILLALTSLPILISGKLLEHIIKNNLFNPTTVVWALGIGGLAIILVERFKFKSSTNSLDGLTHRQALIIGFFQCFALFPGMSRAASTIIGGLFSGLDRKMAAEYSFIAAVPVMCIVSVHDLLEIWDKLQPSDLVNYAIGFVVAFFSAIVAVKFFIHLLQRWTLSPFGFYRIAIALVFFWFFRNSSFIR